MFRLLKSSSHIELTNLGIAFADSLAAHRNIHAHLGAFAGEVHAKPFQHLCVHAGCDADHMLRRVLLLALCDLNERISRRFAHRAEIRRKIA